MAPEKWQFGRVVFFSDLEHVGIVNDRDTFYHSQCSKGTNLSSFEPYWHRLVCGYRAILTPAATDAAPSPPP